MLPGSGRPFLTVILLQYFAEDGCLCDRSALLAVTVKVKTLEEIIDGRAEWLLYGKSRALYVSPLLWTRRKYCLYGVG